MSRCVAPGVALLTIFVINQPGAVATPQALTDTIHFMAGTDMCGCTEQRVPQPAKCKTVETAITTSGVL